MSEVAKIRFGRTLRTATATSSDSETVGPTTHVNVSRKTGRLVALDGLRGLAALIVVFFHFAGAFMPWLLPGQVKNPSRWIDTPLGILINGDFSVSIFFVLSGFVVAQAARNSKAKWFVNVAFRYVRLALPAAFSVLFAWVLLSALPTEALQLNQVLPHQWLSFTYQGHIPSIFSALADGFFGIFVYGSSQFNNVLWTMKIEAIGSILIYAFYGLRVPRHWQIWCLISVVVAVFEQRYLGFVLGAAMSEFYIAGSIKKFAPVISFLVGILLGFPAEGFWSRVRVPHQAANVLVHGSDRVAAIAAALIVYGVLGSSSLENFFSTKPLQWLGKVSFPLYLFHVPLLYTAFALMYLQLRVNFNPNYLPVVLVAFLIVSFALATIGELWVDQPTLKLIKKLKKRSSLTTAPN